MKPAKQNKKLLYNFNDGLVDGLHCVSNKNRNTKNVYRNQDRLIKLCCRSVLVNSLGFGRWSNPKIQKKSISTEIKLQKYSQSSQHKTQIPIVFELIVWKENLKQMWLISSNSIWRKKNFSMSHVIQKRFKENFLC